MHAPKKHFLVIAAKTRVSSLETHELNLSMQGHPPKLKLEYLLNSSDEFQEAVAGQRQNLKVATP